MLSGFNIDLLMVGIAVASIVILGFVVFFNNRKSITNRTFLLFTLLTAFWGATNYLAYNVFVPEISLWLFRIVIFFAIWHDFFIFSFFYVFPEEKINFPKWYRLVILPLVAATSFFNLTPFVFSRVGEVSPSGQLTKIVNGPGIALFGIMVFALVIGGIVFLIRKIIKSQGIGKTQLNYVAVGTILTFSLLIIFNFILPAFFDNPRFIPLGAVFIFPFAAFTSYAIFRHHLLNVKVIATEILTFILAIVTLFEVILSRGPLELIVRFGIFLLVIAFGILLIKSVLREVEQREQIQKLAENLQVANVKLEELSHFKTQLLSLASHQIKSPLAAIKGFVQLLIEGAYGVVGDKIKETLGKVLKSTDELVGLIDTLLDLRKVEEGKMEYSFEKTDIVRIVSDKVDELRPLATDKKLELQFSPPAHSIFISADAQKISQVIQNLVDNAIKYTPAGFVKVEIEEAGNEVIISVVDSGLGISAILLPHIFEEFTRDERVKAKIRGTGLGLYIAQKIVEAHQGQIWTQSKGEGQGSKFFVKLKKISNSS